MNKELFFAALGFCFAVSTITFIMVYFSERIKKPAEQITED